MSIYFKITLSNNKVFYEEKDIVSWRKLQKYCKINKLKIKKFEIMGKDYRKIKRNHSQFYFLVHDVKASLKNNWQKIKKGYGVACKHPHNIKKCYIYWYNEDGKYLCKEVLGNIPKFYNDIGIPAT